MSDDVPVNERGKMIFDLLELHEVYDLLDAYEENIPMLTWMIDNYTECMMDLMSEYRRYQQMMFEVNPSEDNVMNKYRDGVPPLRFIHLQPPPRGEEE
tara:strand:- start:784 stop:1077 length:294 start_codon:yes stop_codon:yes gene_type:complete